MDSSIETKARNLPELPAPEWRASDGVSPGVYSAEQMREYALAALRAAPAAVEVYRLAQIIREVDGSHSLGASRLAEAILSRIQIAAPAAAGVSVDVIARKVGECRVTIAENAVTVSRGRVLLFSYDADSDSVWAAMRDAAPSEQRAVPEDDRFPGGLADAIAYIDKIGACAAELWQRVNGYETDGSLTELELLEQVETAGAAPEGVRRDAEPQDL